MASSYYITFGTDRVTFPGTTGSIAWDDPSAVPLFNIEFGGDSLISAAISAIYNDEIIYETTLDTAQKLADNIPEGSIILFRAQSPSFYTYTYSSIDGLSSLAISTVDWSIPGASASGSGYITADSHVHTMDAVQKTFTASGNFVAARGIGQNSTQVLPFHLTYKNGYFPSHYSGTRKWGGGSQANCLTPVSASGLYVSAAMPWKVYTNTYRITAQTYPNYTFATSKGTQTYTGKPNYATTFTHNWTGIASTSNTNGWSSHTTASNALGLNCYRNCQTSNTSYGATANNGNGGKWSATGICI